MQKVDPWSQGRCTKWKKTTSALTESFVRIRCKITRSEISVKGLNNGIETVQGFCLGNALNVNGSNEMTD